MKSIAQKLLDVILELEALKTLALVHLSVLLFYLVSSFVDHNVADAYKVIYFYFGAVICGLYLGVSLQLLRPSILSCIQNDSVVAKSRYIRLAMVAIGGVEIALKFLLTLLAIWYFIWSILLMVFAAVFLWCSHTYQKILRNHLETYRS